MKKQSKVINLYTEADKRYDKSAHARHICHDNQEPTIMAVQRNIDNMIATYGPSAIDMINDVLAMKSKKAG